MRAARANLAVASLARIACVLMIAAVGAALVASLSTDRGRWLSGVHNDWAHHALLTTMAYQGDAFSRQDARG